MIGETAPSGGRVLRCTRTLANVVLQAIFLVFAFQACKSDGGDERDTADAGTCGVAPAPSYDHQCVGNIGCNRPTAPTCDCRCGTCADSRCVELVCAPSCQTGGNDGGHDAGLKDEGIDVSEDAGLPDAGPLDTESPVDVLDVGGGVDDAADAGTSVPDTGPTDGGGFPCEYKVNTVGHYMDRDWENGTVIKIGDFAWMGIDDHYFFGTDYDGVSDPQDVYLLDLTTKAFMKLIEGCGDIFNGVVDSIGTRIRFAGDSIFWTRAGRSHYDIFSLDLTQGTSPERWTFDGQFLDSAFGSKIIYSKFLYQSEKTIRDTETGDAEVMGLKYVPAIAYLWENNYVSRFDAEEK